MVRKVVVQLWTGAVEVRRLRFDTAGQAGHVDAMHDTAITANLRRLDIAPPATPEERRARLRNWPTQADLDEIATAWTASNDGVRPAVRVLEEMPSLRGEGIGAGTAGARP